jgi:hypothetical protein
MVRHFAVLLAIASCFRSAHAAEDIVIETFDGVKLRGVYYQANATKMKNNACVMMLHPYTKDGKAQGWVDLAKNLSEQQGYHVIAFDFRFHGGRTMDVIPDLFWNQPFNKSQITGATRKPPKSELSFKDIRNPRDYYPMLVNDVMAVRTYLDVLNDQGKVNTSTIYLVGAGDAASIAFLYMTAEWHREREVPNVAIPPSVVSAQRGLFAGGTSAGRDIAGAVFLSPSRHPSMSSTAIENLVSNERYGAVQLRTETPMLFLNGEKDPKGREGSKYFFDKVLVANPKPNSRIQKLPLTYHVEIKDQKLAEMDLLGKGFETEAKIFEFLTALDKDRKNKVAIPNRKYTKPLPVIFQSYGVGG